MTPRQRNAEIIIFVCSSVVLIDFIVAEGGAGKYYDERYKDFGHAIQAAMKKAMG